MRHKTTQTIPVFTACVIAFLLIAAHGAENQRKDISSKSSSKDIKAMMEASAMAGATNQNHKLLEPLVGTWDYRVKWWMDPHMPPQESSGIAVTKPLLGGRFVQSDHVGTMIMPDADGKMVSKDFSGIAITGYNNMKKQFFSLWLDNMSTAMTFIEGSYDDGTKKFTYRGAMDCPMAPGAPLNIREVIKIMDSDKHVLEWYDTRHGKEDRTMEIIYTRKKEENAAPLAFP